MDLVTTDIETYYDKDYTLRKMTPEEYIRDERFEFVGVSAKLNDQPTQVLFTDNKKQLREWYLDQYPLKAMWLGHNMSGFDSLAITHHLDVHPKFWQCTLAMGRLHHGHQSVALGNLAQAYGLSDKGDFVKDAIGKHYADLSPEEIIRYSAYCMQDTDLCYQLFQRMLPKTPTEELQLINLFTRMFAEPRLELDHEGLELYHKALLDKQEATLQQAAAVAGVEMPLGDDVVAANEWRTALKKKLGSNKTFAALLESYGVEPPLKISKTTGKEAYAFAKTDQGMTDLLEHENPAVATLVAARLGTKSTIEQSRTERFISIATRGKLPALFLPNKTHTNRAAGGGKINLQNMTRPKVIVLDGENKTPKGTLIHTTHGATHLLARNVKEKLILDTEKRMHAVQHAQVYGLRHSLRAPPGFVIVAADSSNIELRVAHLLAGQMDVVERIRAGEDMYSWFASELYGYAVGKKTHPGERQHGKVAMLQLQYQSGAGAFQQAARAGFGLKLNAAQAEETVTLYRGLFPHLPAMWKHCEKVIHAMHAGERMDIDQWGLCHTEKDAIVMPNNTRMYYHNLRQEPNEDTGRPEWVYQDKERRNTRKLYGGKVFQGMTQGLAKIVVFSQMLEIEKRWGAWTPGGLSTGVVLTVHDEVVTVVRDEDGQACLKHSLEVLRTPPKWWPQLPLDAEGDIARSYGAAK